MRLVYNTYRNNKHKAGLARNPSNWSKELVGCIGEYAVAKHLGVAWTGMAGPGAVDVGDRFEVRSTHKSRGHVLVFHYDDPSRGIYFTRVTLPEVEILGYLEPGSWRRKRWRGELRGQPCYWVPVEELKHG